MKRKSPALCPVTELRGPGRALLLAVLAVSAIVAPASAAAAAYPSTVDEHLGLVNDRLDQAQATYGERPAFQGAHQHLARSATLLLENATVTATTELTTAAAALETGRARAQAEGHPERDQAIKDAAVRLAGQARHTLQDVRSGLDATTADGMTAEELDHAALVAYKVLLAEDRLRIHEQARTNWEAGERGETIERSLVGNAGASLLLAELAHSLWENRSQAQESDGVVLERDALMELAHARADHADETAPGMAQMSRQRVDALAREGRPVLAFAAFYLWAQDVSFNEQRIDPENATADKLLDEEAPKVHAWIDALRVQGDLPIAAIESARLAAGENTTDEDRAFAASLVVLAAEHTALLIDGYTGTERELGATLPDPPSESGPSWVLWGLAGVALVVLVALLAYWRKARSA